jgi:apolipoprotein N-acyltransferase
VPEVSVSPDAGPRADAPPINPTDAAAASTGTSHRRLRRLTRPGVGLAGGVLLSLSFPPVDAWYVAPLAVAVIVGSLHRVSARCGLLVGLFAGLGTFVPLLYWLHVVGFDGWLVLAALEAALFAPLGAATALASRLRMWPLWAAAIWVTEEAWRDRIPFGGFPWGRLAFSQGHSSFTPYAAIGGAPLVTFAVALAGCLLAAAALRAWARRPKAAPMLAGLVGGALAVSVIALAVPTPTAGQSSDGPPSATVALVQGNVPHPGLHFLGRPEQVLGNHIAVTEQLAARVSAGELPRPDIVVWPENSSDLDPFRNERARSLIDAAVRTVGVPTLIGAVVDDPADPEHYADNEGIVWDPAIGPGSVYIKQHPVPFGEYIPFRSVLTKFIGRLSLVPKDFVHGKENGVLQLGPVRIGDVICFEVAYDGLVRDTVNSGGRLLVVQTNNATYSRTAESEQQLAISRLRAVEHGRAVLIAATSGISAVIAPDGRLIEKSRELTPALLVHRVPLRDSRTVADHLGLWPEMLLTVLGAAAVGVAVVRRRRRA